MPSKGPKKQIIITVILLALSFSFLKSGFDALGSRKRLQEANERAFELVSQRDELKKDIQYKESSEYVEQSARNDLNMIKPGEKVYVPKGLADSSATGSRVLNGSVLGVNKDLIDSSGSEKNDIWYMWYRLFF